MSLFPLKYQINNILKAQRNSFVYFYRSGIASNQYQSLLVTILKNIDGIRGFDTRHTFFLTPQKVPGGSAFQVFVVDIQTRPILPASFKDLFFHKKNQICDFTKQKGVLKGSVKGRRIDLTQTLSFLGSRLTPVSL